MANRALLHRNKLEAFAEWLVEDGWTIERSPRDSYEILRATKPTKRYPLLVYDRNEGDHLSLLDRDAGVVKAFVRSQNKVVVSGSMPCDFCNENELIPKHLPNAIGYRSGIFMLLKKGENWRIEAGDMYTGRSVVAYVFHCPMCGRKLSEN